MRLLRHTAPVENGITEGVIWKQLLFFFFPILLLLSTNYSKLL